MSCERIYDETGAEVVGLDTLLPAILMRAAALPYDLAMGMLRDKYAEFARRTGSIRKALPIDLQRGVWRYPIPVLDDYLLHSIRGVSLNNGLSWTRAPDTWRGWSGMCGAWRWTIDEDDALVLQTPPSQDVVRGMEIHTQLVPRRCCDSLPVGIADMYGDALAAGVAGEAMNMRGKPWYDPGNSVRVMKLFHQAINDARANAERGKQSVLYMRTRRWV